MRFDPFARRPLEEERKLVGFSVGDAAYAVDIMRVQEIANPAAVVPVPAAPRWVVGVADHRDQAVPVIDLRRRFGLDEAPPTRRTKWVLVASGDRTVGLVVDRVTDVLRVTPSQRRERHALLDGGEEAWIARVYGVRDGLVFEVDPDALIGDRGALPGAAVGGERGDGR